MLLVTHSGPFHADDCMAYVILQHALGGNHEFVRSREKNLIDKADIVWDVGGVFDTNTKRYDHHQPGAPKRENEVPYSSAGLIWRDWGRQALMNILDDHSLVEAVFDRIDSSIILDIDRSDNGVGLPPRSTDLSNMIHDYNLTWDSEFSGNPMEEDNAFLRATKTMESFFLNRIDGLRARYKAHDVVLKAYQNSENPCVLVMNQRMPWKEVAFKAELPILYAVFPATNGNWMVDTLPDKPGSFGQKAPLPSEWAGLKDMELAIVSDIPDAVFVHAGRFIGACKTKEGAILMAKKSLDLFLDNTRGFSL